MAQVKVIKLVNGKLRQNDTTDDVTLNSYTVTGGAASLSSSGLSISTASITISGGNLRITDALHTADVIVGATAIQTLSNKSLVDASSRVVDSSDPTIAIELDAGGTTGTKTTLAAAQTADRVLSLPNATDTLVARATTDTLTNKSISGATNTFSNIPNSATTATASATASTIVARDSSSNTAVNKLIVNAGPGAGIDVAAAGLFEIGTSVGANNILLGSSGSTVVIPGDLTVQGTTVTIDVTNLDVEDKNITVNVGGNDASSEGAGLTINRTSTDGSLIYAVSAATRFKIGDLGSEIEVADISTAQTLTNKTIAVASNLITGTANRAVQFNGSGNLIASTVLSSELGFLSGVTSQVVGTTDARTLTSKTISVASNDITGTSARAAQFSPAGNLESSTTTTAQLGFLGGAGSTVVGVTDSATFSNKVIPAATNSITSTASRAAQFDGSGFLSPSTVTTTELGYVSGVTSPIQTQLNGTAQSNTGDINDTLFISANNTAVATNVTGLAFSNAAVRACRILVSVSVIATAELYEVFDMIAIQRNGSWVLQPNSTGDDSGYDFTITNAGQIQYTNGNYVGFVSGHVRFRAQTLVV